MTKITFYPSINKYQNTAKYRELSSKETILRGRNAIEYRVRENHSRGLGFQFSSGIKAALAAISIIGILFFRKQVLELWNEAMTGKKTYKFYVLSESGKTETKKTEDVAKTQLKADEASTAEKPIELAEPSKVPTKKSTKANFSESDEQRIISRGIFGKLNYSILQTVIGKVHELLRDEQVQKEFFGAKEHPGVGIVDLNDLRKKFSNQNVYEADLQAAIRLMVLRGEASFSARARVGHYVAWDPALAAKYQDQQYDKERLIQIDKFMSLNHIDQAKLKIEGTDKDILQLIIDKINEYNYQRAKGWKKPLELNFAGSRRVPTGAVLDWSLDKLVKADVIESYNITRMSTRIVKFSKDDEVEIENVPYNFKEWRNKEIIVKEEQFKKENNIELSPEVRSSFDGNKDILDGVVRELNKRRKAGPYQVYSTNNYETQKALKFLMAEGLVYNFTSNYNGPVTVWVKGKDKLDSALQT